MKRNRPSGPSLGLGAGKLDQFESAFRSASKTVFTFEPTAVASVLLVTDRSEYEADLLGRRVSGFLRVLEDGDGLRWRIVNGSEFHTIPELLGLVEDERPDLICTYRHLHSESWRWPYTLGEYVDVLTQVTTTPVLVLPHPDAHRESEHALMHTASVMAITDHLTGDARLVNYAVRLTEPDGTLLLTHVQDEKTFDRFVEVISKIPSIDTEPAKELIHRQLLKEPTDYIRSCQTALREAGVAITIEEIVTLGHHLHAYERLIEEHHVDLLVFNTKDDDQLAMHGLAYPLAVQLRQIPLLML